MNEFLLPLITFLLGIAATLLTQILARRAKLGDARRGQRIAHLAIVREWMESYRALFSAEYPNLDEFVLYHRYFVSDPLHVLYDATAVPRLYSALKTYIRLQSRHEEAERKGKLALRALAGSRSRDRLPLLIAALTRRSLNRYLHQPGFPRAIGDYLDELAQARFEIFNRFPETIAYRIEWKKIDHIEPSDISSIIHPVIRPIEDLLPSEYTEKELELIESRPRITRIKHQALQTIDNILDVIRRYESKWLPPAS